MRRSIDLVVTCTDRKAVAPEPELRVRALPASGGVPSASTWLHRLAKAPQNHLARDLYQGEMWSCALDLEAAAAEVRGAAGVRLWVVSAGFGLVSANDYIASYAATFASPSPDFVGGTAVGSDATLAAQDWWHHLINLKSRGAPRSLEELARSAEGDVLVVLSNSYVRACLGDLVRAVRANEALTVISPSAQRFPQLRDAAPPFDARLLTTDDDRLTGVARPIARGTRMSLNLRVARLLVEHCGADAVRRDLTSSYLSRLTAAQPPLRRFTRDAMTDAQVTKFITDALAQESVSKTSLLQRLRSDGMQCEQKRFGRLYGEVVNSPMLERSA